jgi:hypothetical protein
MIEDQCNDEEEKTGIVVQGSGEDVETIKVKALN